MIKFQSLPWFSTLSASKGHLRDIGYLVAANLFKILVGFGISAIIFRAIGPTDAGRLTLALSVVGLLSILGEFGLRDAAVNYISRFMVTRQDRAFAIGRAFLFSRIVLAAFASAVGILMAGIIASQFYQNARVDDLIRLGAVSLFTSGLLAFSFVVLEATQKFSVISALGIFQSSLRALLVLALFLVQGVSLYSLLLLEALVPLAAFLYSLRFIPRAFLVRPSGAWLADSSFPLRERLNLLGQMTKWVAIAAFASLILDKLDVLMLSAFRSPAEVGIYAVALVMVTRLDVVKSAVLTTAFPEACRRTERSELRNYIVQSIRLTGIATIALMPLFLVARSIIQWLYGVEYDFAAPAFYLLLAGFLVSLNAEPAAYVVYPLNRTRWIAAGDMVQLAFAFGLNLVLIPRFGFLGAAWTVLLTRLLHMFITGGFVYYLVWRPKVR